MVWIHFPQVTIDHQLTYLVTDRRVTTPEDNLMAIKPQ
jgi:hypothetical protein